MKGMSNIERYKKDYESLKDRGTVLHLAMQHDCFPEEFLKMMKKHHGDNAKTFIANLPDFSQKYESWYSEALVLIRQILPDRIMDFLSLYKDPKPRKEINYGNYCIDDYLKGLEVTRGYEKTKIVGKEAAIPRFRQQLSIIDAVGARFESSLFDIRQLVQGDLFDSELDAASELLKQRFTRAAGALAGVVLERHLGQVCENHKLQIAKKKPTMVDLYSALKEADIIDIPTWRHIQLLADIRNLCDHNKKDEPTEEQVKDLVDGIRKYLKTLF